MHERSHFVLLGRRSSCRFFNFFLMPSERYYFSSCSRFILLA
jgi:hypothetical protein